MGSDSAFTEPFYEYKKEKENTIEEVTEHVRKWQKELGLIDWEISIKESSSDENRAWVKSNVEGRIATIFYDKKWCKEAKTKEIDRVMFHEMCEVLLSHIFVDMNRFYSESYIQERFHEIIRVMENKILGLGV